MKHPTKFIANLIKHCLHAVTSKILLVNTNCFPISENYNRVGS